MCQKSFYVKKYRSKEAKRKTGHPGRGGSGTGDTGDWTPVDFQQRVTVTRPEMTQSDKFIRSTLNKNRKKGWRSDFGVKSNI